MSTSKFYSIAAVAALSLGLAASAHATPCTDISFTIVQPGKGTPKAPKGQVYAVLQSMSGCGSVLPLDTRVALSESRFAKNSYELRISSGTPFHQKAKAGFMMDWQGELIMCVPEKDLKSGRAVLTHGLSGCNEGAKWIGIAWSSPPQMRNAFEVIKDALYTPTNVQNSNVGKTDACVTFNTAGYPMQLSESCSKAQPAVVGEWQKFLMCIQNGLVAAQKAKQEVYSCPWKGVSYAYKAGSWSHSSRVIQH